MQVNVNIGVEDLWQGNKTAYLKSPSLRKNFIKSIAATPIGLMIALLFLKNALNLSIAVIILAGLAGGCLINLLMIYAAKSKIVNKTPGFKLVQTVELMSNGFKLTGSKNAFVSWGNVIDILKDKEYILFVSSDHSVQIIPKNSFDSSRQAEEFYAKATEYKNTHA